MRSGGGLDACGMERNRRNKMSELYTTLRTLLPNLFPRATRARIIDEVLAHIKVLKDTITVLEAYKEATAATGSGRASQPAPALRTESGGGGRCVEVTVSGSTVFFGVSLMARPGLLTRVLEVFHRHDATVLAATLTCHHGGHATVTVTSVVMQPETVDSIKAEILSI